LRGLQGCNVARASRWSIGSWRARSSLLSRNQRAERGNTIGIRACGKAAAAPFSKGPKRRYFLAKPTTPEVLENPRVGSSILSLGTVDPAFRGVFAFGMLLGRAVGARNAADSVLAVAPVLQSVCPRQTGSAWEACARTRSGTRRRDRRARAQRGVRARARRATRRAPRCGVLATPSVRRAELY
jgi:hypothetical protein